MCSDNNNDNVNMGVVQSLSSGLNESQTGTVLACLEMLHSSEESAVELIRGPPGTGKTKHIVTILLTLLQMNFRTLVCAPVNVAIAEIASCVVKMVTEVESNALYCSLEKVLFENKERLKVGSDIEEIFLDYLLRKLDECLEPQTGWRHCFSSMIECLEDGVSLYRTFLENGLAIKMEPKTTGQIKVKESRCVTEVRRDNGKTFLEFIRDRFVSTALLLRYYISIFCTHMAKNHICVEIFLNMVSLVKLVDSFESLLFQCNVASEVIEGIFFRSGVEYISETYVDNLLLLFTYRRECLKVLHKLFDTTRKLDLPDFMTQQSLTAFCFQKSASLMFCTASSSYKLHKLAMEPLSIVVIDEAAQLKEWESTIPLQLQLQGVKHAVLVGDECQLPAIVKSIFSDDAGFERSLFERLSSVGPSKLILNMQYGMHPLISSFPNSSFYNNMILDAPYTKRRSQDENYLKGSMFGGQEENDEDGRSRNNMVEVAIVSQRMQNLYKEWLDSKQKLSTGVVSPYAAQLVAVDEKLGQKYDNLDGFIAKEKTVDEFQVGGEEDIIIYFTVLSNCQKSLEFISDPQRIKVALTWERHWLWVLGNERTLCDSESVWEAWVLDAKNCQHFFNADEEKDSAKALLQVKKQSDQLDDLLNSDGVLFRKSKWKVLFGDNFVKSFKKLKSVSLKRSVLNVLLKLASGGRPKMQSSDILCGNSSLILKNFKVEDLCIVCPADIAKDSRDIQVLKSWGIMSVEDPPALVNRLHNILCKLMPNCSLQSLSYTDEYINLCKENCLEGNVISSTNIEAEYDIVSWHGTTVLWIQLREELIVGVDSFAVSRHVDDTIQRREDYEGLMSEIEQKFVLIVKDVYATLSGGGKRCNGMVLYVRTQILKFIVEGKVPTIELIGEAATDYFHKKCRLNGTTELPSTVFICCWTKKKYFVIEVGDLCPKARNVDEVVFGSGSGSRKPLMQLEKPTTPKDEATLKDELIKSVFDDPCTGGVLRVFSLKNGICDCTYEGIVLDELRHLSYSNILFDGKTMFVIIHKGHECVLNRLGLLRLLEKKFGVVATAHWLCVLQDALLVYRVTLPSVVACHSWFNSCLVSKEHLRYQNYSNRIGRCPYFLCYASRHMLEQARDMTLFGGLFDVKKKEWIVNGQHGFNLTNRR